MDLNLASRSGWIKQVQYQQRRGFTIAIAKSRETPGPKGTLLLLHGFPTNSWDWYKLWPLLMNDYQLVAPDLLGFGLSQKPKDHVYTMAEQADICEAVLRVTQVDRFSIIAHDYGDTVAQELMMRHIEGDLEIVLDKVIMLNGGILPDAHRPLPIQKLLAGPLGSMIRHLMTKQRFKKNFSAIFGDDTKPVDAELNMMWGFITEADGHRRSPEILRYIRERQTYSERWVPQVINPPVPLQLIFGAADPVSGAHLLEAYREADGKADIVELEGIGHYPQLEAPEKTADAILDFLKA